MIFYGLQNLDNTLVSKNLLDKLFKKITTCKERLNAQQISMIIYRLQNLLDNKNIVIEINNRLSILDENEKGIDITYLIYSLNYIN